MLDLLACGVAVLDAEDQIRSWNDAAGSILGWRPDDAVGQDAVELTIPASQRSVARSGLVRLRREGFWKGNLLLRRAAGETVLCAVRVQTLPDDGFGPDRLLVVFVAMAWGQGSLQAGKDPLTGGISLLQAHRFGDQTAAEIYQGQVWRSITST